MLIYLMIKEKYPIDSIILFEEENESYYALFDDAKKLYNLFGTNKISRIGFTEDVTKLIKLGYNVVVLQDQKYLSEASLIS